MKKRLALVPIIAGLFLLISAGSVMAAEPAEVMITFLNNGNSDVQIAITETGTQETETITIPAKDSIKKTWTMTEPGVTELLAENTDPESKDPSYVVWLYAENDEAGTLRGYVVSKISGTTEKPEKLVFGTDEEETETESEDPTKDPTKKPTGKHVKKPTNPPEKKPSGQSALKTGDNAKLEVWIGLGTGFAFLLLFVIVVLIRRNKKEEGGEGQ